MALAAIESLYYQNYQISYHYHSNSIHIFLKKWIITLIYKKIIITTCFYSFQISTIVSILLSLVPFIFLIILNIFIYYTIKQKTVLLPISNMRQRRDIFVATILVLIVMVYAACHSIKTVINIIELQSVLSGNILGFFFDVITFVKHLLTFQNV